MTGIAYLIGAGPGDPGLLTLRGKECIESADVIIYDYLADESLLEWVSPNAEILYAGKRAGQHTLTQEEINQFLVDKVSQGKVVARLKGGDPFVFGRGGEEALALHEANLEFEIIPGVTSAIAAPAYAGIPVTQRAMATSFAVITGHEDPTKECSGVDWEKIANGADTLTFVMGLGNLPEITEKLQAFGRSADTPAAVVRWGTKPEQKTVTGTLETIAEIVKREEIKPPGLFIVGDVVGLRKQLNWYEKKPLFGKKVVVTRAKRQAGGFARILRDRGAKVFTVPAIRIVPTDNSTEQAQTIMNMDRYDWVLFTSVNTVQCFFASLYKENRDSRIFGGKKIMAVGKKTAAELKKHGICADYVPVNSTAEGMLEILTKEELQNKKILLPRAVEARELLPETLRKYGAEVYVLPVYKTEPEVSDKRIVKWLQNNEVDVITFTSSSTVRNILAMLGDKKDLLKKVKVAAIGNITANTLKEFGFIPNIVAAEATVESLADAVEQICGKEDVK